MAVYTTVDRDILQEFLALYDIGALVSHEGIEAGVSNTNYVVRTDRDKYILTLFEPHRVRDEDIPFFTRYTDELFQAGLPVPEIIRSRSGAQVVTLCGRLACFTTFLAGTGGHAGMITPDICGEAGALLGHMHLATARMEMFHPDPYGPDKWREWIGDMGEDIDGLRPGLRQICAGVYNAMAAYPCEDLTSGPIHGDFFPDNVFFDENDEICGLIDFHFASTGWFLYDLAIAVNAWCFDRDNIFQQARYNDMMEGYRAIMPLEAQEYDAMPLMLQLAAMRFLLSRIEEKKNWTPDRLGKPHDPAVFLERLEHFL